MSADAPVVGFLGPAGTFSEVAADRIAGDWAGQLVPAPTIVGLIATVAAGEGIAGSPRLDAAVVPIENSTEGSVGATLDTLAGHDNLTITAELDLPIEQLLLARTALPLETIEQVHSHPQGIAQTSRFLAANLPQASVVPVDSTSRSVELVCGSPEPWAAIGSRRAAELYGAIILCDDIQEAANVTRFVLVQRAGDLPSSIGSTLPAGSPMKTSIVFEGEGNQTPGWLVRCLGEFAARDVNLSKIESRPLVGELGSYRFFVDLVGGDDEGQAAAIAALRGHCTRVRILGSYPVASIGA